MIRKATDEDFEEIFNIINDAAIAYKGLIPPDRWHEPFQELIKGEKKPILIGTWKAADWAIRFYEKHGFRLVEEEEKNRLLKKYWAIPDRQIETSVVLVDGKYRPAAPDDAGH